jgi:hypothetical protein
MSLWKLCAAAALAALAAAPAAAQPITLEFASGGSFTTAFTAPAGGTVPVQVYIDDAGTTLRGQNLRGAGFTLTSSNPGVALVQSDSDIVPNPAFNFVTTPPGGANAAAGTATLQEQLLGGSGVPTEGGPGQPPPNRVFLGTFDFAALSPGVTTLTFSDNQAGFANITTGDETSGGGTVLDGSPGLYSARVATITVAPVPEPGSLLLGGTAAAGGLAIRYRRRRAATTTPAK